MAETMIRACKEEYECALVILFGRQSVVPQIDMSNETLSKIVPVSGGIQLYADNLAQMRAAFEIIAATLRSQYVIGFKPAQAVSNDKWRRLRVSISSAPDAPRALRNLSTRHREGYYAISNQR
jgi:hypothetical protein